jgi:hypothetical protein
MQCSISLGKPQRNACRTRIDIGYQYKQSDVTEGIAGMR